MHLELRLFSELIRVKLQRAQLMQQYLARAAEGQTDPKLHAEWEGQETAYKQLLDILGESYAAAKNET